MEQRVKTKHRIQNKTRFRPVASEHGKTCKTKSEDDQKKNNNKKSSPVVLWLQTNENDQNKQKQKKHHHVRFAWGWRNMAHVFCVFDFLCAFWFLWSFGFFLFFWQFSIFCGLQDYGTGFLCEAGLDKHSSVLEYSPCYRTFPVFPY